MAGVPDGEEGQRAREEVVIGTDASTRATIRRMLEPRSVAVVGASIKQGSLGASMMAELRRGGFEGAVYPVNPGYDEVDGYTCYPSIGDVPEAVDLAILGVSNARIEQALTDAAAAGASSAVTFSSLYEEPTDGPDLRTRLRQIAVSHGMPMCGGNGMGFVNVASKTRACGFETPDDLRAGPVTFISHSGSAFSALSFNDRGIGFNLLVSSGQEIVTTMDGYIQYALDLDGTRVIALLLETVRDPDALRGALRRADALGTAVVALKAGRSAASSAMVTAHSGALAGEHGAYEALFDAYGVHEVRTLDEMADTIELFASPRRVTHGSGIASVHDSGGERAMFVDVAGDIGVPFASVGDETIARIADTLDPGMESANPLDAWGTGIDGDRIFREAFAAFRDDLSVSASVFCIDLTKQGEPYGEGYLQISKEAWEASDDPFCVLSNLASAVEQTEARVLRDRGIPVLEGTETGLQALRHLLADGERRSRQPATPPAPVDASVRDRWRRVLSRGERLPESTAMQLLTDYGIPTIRAVAIGEQDQVEEVRAGAEELGYPVALKTASPDISHKTEAGGVRLGLSDREELTAAYEDIVGRLGPLVTVSAMAPAGVEIALGVVNDATFGPLVVVAAGGILVELLHDRVLAMPPLEVAAAHRLIDRLAIRPMLDGVRGAPPADVDALAGAVSRLSVLAADVGDLVSAIDVNPVIVGQSGCVAVDVLIEPARSG
jgi:acyl-CoA synthetase (NDP forming)